MRDWAFGMPRAMRLPFALTSREESGWHEIDTTWRHVRGESVATFIESLKKPMSSRKIARAPVDSPTTSILPSSEKALEKTFPWRTSSTVSSAIAFDRKEPFHFRSQ
ncbi:hypothetical protein XU18_4409 [Perkinsela sp. CCAP 1560/4]|nr:hypothetical protein XU18_4409 [Perkinsela sp. CCAP 1560/4]|eukprot:KNH04199.1 hypothetical protein XU18_4409 [Perkinsela sp. CCAP 1560/4]